MDKLSGGDIVPTSALSPIFKTRTDSITPSEISQLQSLQVLRRKSTTHQPPSTLSPPHLEPQPNSTQDLPCPLPSLQSEYSPKEKSTTRPSQPAKNRTLVSKMRLKLEEQAEHQKRHLDEKRRELEGVNEEITNWESVLKRKRLSKQDNATSQQTLLFRQTQLSNLVMIHSEIVEAAKREVTAEHRAAQTHREDIARLREEIGVLREARVQREVRKEQYSQLSSTLQLLREKVESLRRVERQKSRIRSQATIEVIREITKQESEGVTKEIEEKMGFLRSVQKEVRSLEEFNERVSKQFSPCSYLTCSQLKLLPEFSRIRPRQDAQQILSILQQEVKVQGCFPALSHSPPPELRQVNEQLARLNLQKEGQLAQMLQAEELVEELRGKKRKLLELTQEARCREH